MLFKILSASMGGTVHAPINPNLSSLLSNRFVQIRKIQTKSHPVCSKVIVYKSCGEILTQCATCTFGPTRKTQKIESFWSKKFMNPRQPNWPKLVYDRNHYFGLGPIPKPKPKLADTFGRDRNRYRNHISKRKSGYQSIVQGNFFHHKRAPNTKFAATY